MLEVTSQEYYEEFLAEIRVDVGHGEWEENSFFEKYCNLLLDSGSLSEAQRSIFNGQWKNRQVRVDGYEDDPIATNGILTLIVCDYTGTISSEIEIMNRDEMVRIFSRCERFITNSLDYNFRDDLEANADFSPVFLAEMINSDWEYISAFRIVLLTDKTLSIRGNYENSFVKNDSGTIKEVIREVWDFERYKNDVLDGSKGFEPIIIDFIEETGNSIPILSVNTGNSEEYKSYVGIISGEQLAAIYGRYQNRLLEQNVRVFLQATGNVNRGILATLQHNPGMFFAYNNGITCTADEIIVENDQIKSITNFQIVNGGQTTASIHRAKSDIKINADLSKVFVQMKLSIISKSVTDDGKVRMVSDISRFANTQNKVNASDFFSNHPYHQQLEKLSRETRAPLLAGTTTPTKWYYERVRGQWKDEKSKCRTDAEKTRFENEFPSLRSKSKTGRIQKIDKGDVARFINIWDQLPHTVSKGKEDNFKSFAADMAKTDWEKIKDNYNNQYFTDLIAKAIIYQDVDQLVVDQNWGVGVYKAPIVTYSMAKLAYDIENGVFGKNKSFNFDIVWQAQKIDNELKMCFEKIIIPLNDLLNDPPEGMPLNASTWAKRESLWNYVKLMNIEWPESINKFLISAEDAKKIQTEARKDQRNFKSGYDAQTTVINAGEKFWTDVYSWGTEWKHLSENEILLFNKYFSDGFLEDFRSKQLLACLERLQKEGCSFYIEDL
tara:strand:- start:2199 stop:4364 length:2166 start_codon:yes stop_codon:yes gene_type:complete